jgi:mycoredoxin
MRGTIIFYGHSGCPSVPLVRMILEQSGAEFEYINIWADDAGRTRVRGINQGYESVPTLVFPDGSIVVTPKSWTQKCLCLF